MNSDLSCMSAPGPGPADCRPNTIYGNLWGAPAFRVSVPTSGTFDYVWVSNNVVSGPGYVLVGDASGNVVPLPYPVESAHHANWWAIGTITFVLLAVFTVVAVLRRSGPLG
jgi:hypothetical protein